MEKIKKNILIVEDNEDDWRSMYSWMTTNFNIFPKEEKQFGLLREHIAGLYAPHSPVQLMEEARTAIAETLGSFGADLYVVDYQLHAGNRSANGIRFCEDFLPDKVILMVTGTEGKTMHEVVNKMKRFCEQEGYKEKRDYLCKEDLNDDDFMRVFGEKISTLLNANEPYEAEDY